MGREVSQVLAVAIPFAQRLGQLAGGETLLRGLAQAAQADALDSPSALKVLMPDGKTVATFNSADERDAFMKKHNLSSKKLDVNNPDDVAIGRRYLQRAGGDKAKARQMATADGYTF